ncbi:type I iodothyronine deiodinase-like [Dendronephthya gigantea]|uniref:type I iodothyronine deiodinase-like n=1 Tax=Dendronephthya gigantea TaxID=151771 RepID=UPI001069B976|nr:type I iodothyronine deiodinase-like [Dendronephthya gigantea]
MACKTLSLVGLFIELFLLYVVGNIVKHIPCAKRMIIKRMNRKASIVMPVDNYWHTLFSWSLIQTLWKYGKYELSKTSKVGCVAPNPPLVTGEKGQTSVHLLDLVKNSRPLVVIFGSCTCPVIITKLDQMLEVHRDFSDIADFVVIYVQEAHPDDGWRMKNNYNIRRHKSIEDRVEASQTLRSLLPSGIRFCVDTMTDEASKSYSGCPNRILVIEEDTLVYQNGPGPTWFDFDETRECLQKYRNNNVV